MDDVLDADPYDVSESFVRGAADHLHAAVSQRVSFNEPALRMSDPARCRCFGTGLYSSIVRQETAFNIEAYNGLGERQREGGDLFSVSIMGSGVRIHARVSDEGDGSYEVRYRAFQSGSYRIVISLFGEVLPGCPFLMASTTPSAVASECKLRGPALHEAVSRVTQFIEIDFKDAQGQTAHAEELDVHVVRLDPDPVLPAAAAAPAGGEGEETGEGQKAASAAAAALAATAPPPRKELGKGGGGGGASKAAAAAAAAASSSTSKASVAQDASRLLARPVTVLATALSPSEGGGAGASSSSSPSTPASTPTNKLRAGVITSKAPLIVRAGTSLDSERIGQLKPGRKVYLLKVIEDEGGTAVRALAAVDADEDVGILRRQHEEQRQQQRQQQMMMLSSQLSSRGGGSVVGGYGGSGGGGPLTLYQSGGDLTWRSGDQSWREQYVSKPMWIDADDEPGGWYGDQFSPRSNSGSIGSPRSPRRPKRVTVGWVTVVKDGRRFVTLSTQLASGTRQQHIQAWARRLAVDKAIEVSLSSGQKKQGDTGPAYNQVKSFRKRRGEATMTSAQKQMMRKRSNDQFKNEIACDPTGVGFAFGGIYPGRLHAHGKLIDTHRVSYSIGLVGNYELHIGLRQQDMPLPGSPFMLKVLPGPASAISTSIPESVSRPLLGTVGFEEGQGCTLTLAVSDKMGNVCVTGGANVVGRCYDDEVHAETIDNDDGTYLLRWKSQTSSNIWAHIEIEGEPIGGSPIEMSFVSDQPVLSETVSSGDGLRLATAGNPAEIVLRLLDQYGNIAIGGPRLSFGYNLAQLTDGKEEKGKWRRSDSKSDPFEGAWDRGEYKMTFMPELAGTFELYLWAAEKTEGGGSGGVLGGGSGKASKRQSGERREALPNSPFKLIVEPDAANPVGSFIEGFSKAVGAGDTIAFRPSIRDRFGNATNAPEEGGLRMVVTREESVSEVAVTPTARGDLMVYEGRLTPKILGKYSLAVLLKNEPIRGSPVAFEVLAGTPDVKTSKLVLPEGPLFPQTEYDLVIVSVDKYGNECVSGGAYILAKLTGANLPPGQETSVVVHDRSDGTYALKLVLKAPADVKVVISVAKDDANINRSLTPDPKDFNEFAPVALKFESVKAVRAREERESRLSMEMGDGGGASNRLRDSSRALDAHGSLGSADGDPISAHSSSGSNPAGGAAGRLRKMSLKGAIKEVAAGFGSAAERRPKQLHGSASATLEAAAQAFKQAGAAASANSGKRKGSAGAKV